MSLPFKNILVSETNDKADMLCLVGMKNNVKILRLQECIALKSKHLNNNIIKTKF